MFADHDFHSQGDILEDAPGEDGDQFIPNFRLPNVSMSMPGQASPQAHHLADAVGGAFGGSGNHGFDPYDPMMDADPFGLSASMHFPTLYTYDQHQHQHRR